MVFGPLWVELTGVALQFDATAAGLLDAVGLHVDVLLHLLRQFRAVGREQPPQMAGEDVKLLQVRVGEGQHLGQEGIEAHVVGQLASEVRTLLLGESPEPGNMGREEGIDLILARLAVEVEPGELLGIGLGVDVEVEQSLLDVVEQVRIGRLREQGRLVVGLKGLADGVGFVGEVEHHRLAFLRMRPVQPRQGLHGVHAAQLLVHVHGVEQGLIEARLEFVRDH